MARDVPERPERIARVFYNWLARGSAGRRMLGNVPRLRRCMVVIGEKDPQARRTIGFAAGGAVIAVQCSFPAPRVTIAAATALGSVPIGGKT